jgi:hypothetical protein
VSGKRDFIGEIKAYVKRSALAVGNETAKPDAMRWNAIIAAFAAAASREISDEELCDELRRHVVVSLVAMIQGSARRTIAEIIDGKEEREEELPELQDVRITLAMVRELKKREFSIGELVAHFSSLGGFEQISSALQRVSGEDLNTILLNSFRDDTRRTEGFENPEKALANTRAQLVKLFYYRNIYCHEEGVGISVKDDEVREFIIATANVVVALGLLRAKSMKH